MFRKYLGILILLTVSSCQHSENCDNFKKVKNGMNVKEVLDIMKNEPESIKVNFLGNNQFSYMYLAPYGASDNVYINFSDKDSVVLSAHGCD